MTKQKQQFTLSLEEIRLEKHTDAPQLLQDFLSETSNHILEELEILYRENPSLTSKDHRVQKIQRDIEARLESSSSDKQLVNASNDMNALLNDPNKGTNTHLAFALQGLKHGKNLKDIMHGYLHDGQQRIGLSDLYKSQFIRDFDRTPTRIINQEGVVLDSDFSRSMDNYHSLCSALTKLKVLHKKEPFLKNDDKRIQAIYAQLEMLSERINDNPTLFPEVSKSKIGRDLKFIMESIKSRPNLNQVMTGYGGTPGVLVRFSPKLFKAHPKKESFVSLLKERLNLSDEQTKFIVGRYNQRSITASGTSFGATKVGELSGTFYVNQDGKGKLSLQQIELKSKGKGVAFDEEDTPFEIDTQAITYRADVSKLTRNDSAKERFIALPTQKVQESVTCKAVHEDGIVEIPESLKARTVNNRLLSKAEGELTDEDVLKIANLGNIEKELSFANLEKLMNLVIDRKLETRVEAQCLTGLVAKLSKQGSEVRFTEVIVKKVIENEVDKVLRTSSADKPAQIKSNLADIFQKEAIKTDKLVDTNIKQYIQHKDPGIMTKLSQYFHAVFIHRVKVGEYLEQKLSKQLNRTQQGVMSHVVSSARDVRVR